MINELLNGKKKDTDVLEIDTAVMSKIHDELVQSYPKYVIHGLTDEHSRKRLKEIILKDYSSYLKGKSKELVADYIVQEVVGIGVIEEIVRDYPDVTDIGFNGTHLIVETNDDKFVYNGLTEVTEEYIVRIITKFANAVGKDFSPKEPILDAVVGNVRISATHRENSPYGTTASFRIVKPELALQGDNLKLFAPPEIIEFFKHAMKIKTNIIIAGETGTGKTELQKLLMSFIEFQDKAIVIEDVNETHAKELFPDKDIYSWLTDEKTQIEDLVKGALRNNPRWIMVAETRGAEAYQMLQAVLSSHYIVTSLHAVDAFAIPRRLTNMARTGYSIDEDMFMDDVRRYINFGVLVKRIRYKGVTIRYLAEIVEYNADGRDTLVFSQRFKKGNFVWQTNDVSTKFKEKIDEYDLDYEFYAGESGVRELVM